MLKRKGVSVTDKVTCYQGAQAVLEFWFASSPSGIAHPFLGVRHSHNCRSQGNFLLENAKLIARRIVNAMHVQSLPKICKGIDLYNTCQVTNLIGSTIVFKLISQAS